MIQNNMSVRKNKRQARKYPSTDFLLLLCIMLFCRCSIHQSNERINLEGTWRFAIDRQEVGISEQWYLQKLPDYVQLPGSMLSNGKGDAVNLGTPWTGSLFDKSFFTEKKFNRYRQSDNFKVPFWLQPEKYYTGVAWYQRDIDIPAEWQEKAIRLFFERCHWESRVWIDSVEVGMRNTLSAPQEYDLTGLLTPGKHVITVRVDNMIREIDPGENSHSISDHTQGNWNGVTGEMFIEAKSPVYYEDITLFPTLSKSELTVKTNVRNVTGKQQEVNFFFMLEKKRIEYKQVMKPGDNKLEFKIPLSRNMTYWDEFHPNLYTLHCGLQGFGTITDDRQLTFGCREWEVREGVLYLNGHPAFMRGTLHCASFPLTGYPSTDKEEWLREFRICKEHGLNHIRFHSWCPPEAAFEAADELGIYCQVECSSWPNQSSSIGDGKPIDAFLQTEAEYIVKVYGNHPSFCMLALGNEPGGNHKQYLTNFVSYWKARDNRRLYTTAAGWPNIQESDFLSDSQPRIQHWEEGLGSIINSKEPSTAYDWSDYTDKFNQPFISHEIGQWCVYLNFKEIAKYTGVYKAKNFEIFQESLRESGMEALADSFLLASGKLQTICYKADIEAALRTSNFGGFQLLGLSDFTGQGTALVGTLDAFWEEKGYVTPEEYRRFCNSVVPLARIPRLVFENDEKFVAQIEAANYNEEMQNPKVCWIVRDGTNKIVRQGKFSISQIAIGNRQSLGSIEFNLKDIEKPAQLTLEVLIDNYANNWNFWVYPTEKEIVNSNDILLTDYLDKTAIKRLNNGGKVLLSLKKGTLKDEYGGNLAIGFSSIFWNTSWTNGQAPHTLGILCNPKHPALAAFPTEYHSNYQWWDAMTHSAPIRINKVSKEAQPIVRVIDDWFSNHPLALLFEVKIGKGKLLVSGIDFHRDMQMRPAARQLLSSLLNYMQSSDFSPRHIVKIETINDLIDK